MSENELVVKKVAIQFIGFLQAQFGTSSLLSTLSIDQNDPCCLCYRLWFDGRRWANELCNGFF
jgi:hypothetical protein